MKHADDVNARIHELRQEATELLALLETAYLPPPTRIRDAHEPLPGPEWTVDSGRDPWRVHAGDGDGRPNVVFVHTPDAMYPGDVLPLPVAEARRFAMAILAACDWTDRHHPPPNIPLLADARRKRKEGRTRAEKSAVSTSENVAPLPSGNNVGDR